MAPPQLFINTKTLELDKQPDVEKEDGHESKKEREDDKKEKENDSDASDPSKGIKAKFLFPLPICSYILMFTGLAITLAGVSFNKNDDDNLIFSSLPSQI